MKHLILNKLSSGRKSLHELQLDIFIKYGSMEKVEEILNELISSKIVVKKENYYYLYE